MLDVLVTGSRGFIGQHLVNKLKEDSRVRTIVGIGRTDGDSLFKARGIIGSKNVELRTDITKQEEVGLLMQLVKPHVIFHLAAIPLTKLDELNPTEITRINVIGTQNLLHSALHGPRFVLASSATVYGDSWKPGYEDDPPTPTSVYGATKVASEAMVSAYTKMGRVNGLSLRYVANVGRGATHGVLPDVIRKLRSDNPVLELFGDEPGTEKPYTHIDDTTRLTVFFGLNTCHQGAINIAPINSITIRTLAQTVMNTLKINKEIKWLGRGTIWSGDNPVVRVNDYKLMSLDCELTYKTSEQAIAAATREL